MAVRRTSIVTVEGFQSSYVDASNLLTSERIKHTDDSGNTTTLKQALGEAGGVTQVDTLPATGEGGKIYYNTTDGKYYTYSDGEYTPLGSSEVAVITDITDVEVYAVGGVTSECTYVIEPNIFYNIEDWDNSSPSGSADGLILYINSVEGPYAGRFTAWKDNMFLGFFVTDGTDVIVPDNIPDIIEGHTYEFNLYQGVCLIVDITSTEGGE